MVSALNSYSLSAIPSSIQSSLSDLQQATQNLFFQLKEELERVKDSFDLRPLQEPWNIAEGGLWAGFWGLCAVFSGMSLYDLFEAVTTEHPADKRFAKIAEAVKTAFVDLVSLGGASAYNIHWAHQAKILSLGQYAPVFKGLSYGSSLVVNTVEGGWSIYQIALENDAILSAGNENDREQHRQKLCLNLMKVIANVNMVAWTSLGLATIAAGVAVSPILTTALLTGACVFSFAAFFYQRHIEKAPEMFYIPRINYS